MARPEIPSIVVHNGSASAPGSPSMELPSRSLRPTRSLSKQTSLVGEDDFEDSAVCEAGDLTTSSPHSVSLPVTPSSPSPTVSPSTPPVCTPLSSPGHLRSSSPSSNGSVNNTSTSNTFLPPGPGPGGGASLDEGSMAVGHGGPAAPSLAGAPSRSKSLELPHQRSSDSEKDAPLNTSARNRHCHGSKLKLLRRSHAMQEDSSPPPDIIDTSRPMDMLHGPISNNLTVNQGLPMGCPGGPNRRRLRHQGSSQGSFDGSSPSLSRDSSMDFTDSSGVDLLQFIIQTLHKNQKDRMLLFKIERELVNFTRDPKRTHHKFPQMSSYQRMLVHRVAAFFGLEHNVDQVGTCVIVNKTRSMRVPDIPFKNHIREELLPPEEPKRSILRRGFASFEDNYKSPDRLHGIESRRSKSFEEREEEYEKSFISMDSPRRFQDAFMHNSRRNSHDDSRWQDSRHLLLGDTESHRKYYDNQRIRPSRLPKGESFESHDTLNPRSLRPPVFKSHSFGGYSGGVTVLSRGDSVASNPSRLSKQDSTGSRFSDHSSSSGYKTQRQDTSSTNVSNTLSTTPSPTTGQYQHPPFAQHLGMWGGEGDSQAVMWAVTDMEAVPSGAMLINPQSGQPYINPDGSVYRYDPANPPLHMGKHMSTPTHHKMGKDRDRDSTVDKRLQEVKGDSGETEEGSEGASCSSKRTDSRCSNRDNSKHNVKVSVEEEGCGPPNQSYSQYYHQSHVEGRPFSQDSFSEVGNQLRHLNLGGPVSASEGAPDIVSPSASGVTSLHQGYVMPRQQYPQTVYYMPAASMPSLPGGGMKYVYPQYQMAPVQGTASIQSNSLTGTNIQTHPPSIPAMSSVNNIPALSTIPQQLVGPGPPQTHTQVGEANAPLPGYMHNNYTVVAYPPNGLLGTVTSSGGGHESGGTTYYCQLTGPAGLAPVAAAGTASTPAGAPAPTNSLQQYAPSSTGTTTFPMALGYYTASGMNNNGMYQTAGIQGFPGGMYGVPQSHGAVGPHQTAVSFRAPTPPHTPCTQAVGMPMGFSSTGGGGVPPPAGVGGQYITVLPPQPPPTPTSSHAPQLFTTFFRPSVQMMSGSTGTPPPQPVLQYGGGSAPLSIPPGVVTPHPPVYAKSYVGSSIHPLIPGGGVESQGSGGGVSNEESKRYVGSVGSMPHSSGVSGHVPPVVPLTGATTTHLLPRPYTFMQNSLAGSSGGGLRAATPILISGPRPRHFLPSPAGALTPFTLTRQPKFKKQKSRTTYSRSSETTTSHSLEGPNETEKL